ncbi:hypothetical protein [Micromonospora sp. NPDC049679]|uniref:hypothetical protein n=1 Tax=Micromonospora sp. NPDC049679 TaxID=3155920 RepID=UPI0034100EE2
MAAPVGVVVGAAEVAPGLAAGADQVVVGAAQAVTDAQVRTAHAVTKTRAADVRTERPCVLSPAARRMCRRARFQAAGKTDMQRVYHGLRRNDT